MTAMTTTSPTRSAAVKAAPKFFTQWRPARRLVAKSRVIDDEVMHLYVCAFWRARDKNGKPKQAGCSYSAEKHGIEGAARLAMQRASKAHRVGLSVRQIVDQLTW